MTVRDPLRPTTALVGERAWRNRGAEELVSPGPESRGRDEMADGAKLVAVVCLNERRRGSREGGAARWTAGGCRRY